MWNEKPEGHQRSGSSGRNKSGTAQVAPSYEGKAGGAANNWLIYLLKTKINSVSFFLHSKEKMLKFFKFLFCANISLCKRGSGLA